MVRTSRRTSVQPAGGVIVGVPRTLTLASSSSPETVPAGRGRTRVVVVALAALAAERKPMVVGGGGAPWTARVPESVNVLPAIGRKTQS